VADIGDVTVLVLIVIIDIGHTVDHWLFTVSNVRAGLGLHGASHLVIALLLHLLLSIRLDNNSIDLGLIAGLNNINNTIGSPQRYSFQLDLSWYANRSGPDWWHVPCGREWIVDAGWWIRLVQGSIESQGVGVVVLGDRLVFPVIPVVAVPVAAIPVAWVVAMSVAIVPVVAPVAVVVIASRVVAAIPVAVGQVGVGVVSVVTDVTFVV